MRGARRADTKDLLETNVAGALGSAGTGLSELPSTTWQEAQAQQVSETQP